MNSYLLCLPHSPILMCYAGEPPEHEAIQAAYAQQAEAVRAFDPELVILFGTDQHPQRIGMAAGLEQHGRV